MNNLIFSHMNNADAAGKFLAYQTRRKNKKYQTELSRFALRHPNFLSHLESEREVALNSVPHKFDDLIEFLEFLSIGNIDKFFDDDLPSVIQCLKSVGRIPNLRYEEFVESIKQMGISEAYTLGMCLLVLFACEQRESIFEVLSLSLKNGSQENLLLEEWTSFQKFELQGLVHSLKGKQELLVEAHLPHIPLLLRENSGLKDVFKVFITASPFIIDPEDSRIIWPLRYNEDGTLPKGRNDYSQRSLAWIGNQLWPSFSHKLIFEKVQTYFKYQNGDIGNSFLKALSHHSPSDYVRNKSGL
ncbi:MAG: hypothetical protein R3F28_08870 [Candidatus Kapaibacterium sp.]|nr:hypothetical protein [Ignavibacteria bacterium]